MRRSAGSFLLLVNLVIFGPLSAWAEKTDVIMLKNGDKITGEIKTLDRGQLTYDTDDMGTLSVQWDKISLISSESSFMLEDVKGARYYGLIQEGSEQGTLVVITASGPVTLDLDMVVRISQFARRFFRRFQGYLDLGFSFQQANKNTQWNLSTEITFLSEKWSLSMDASSYLSKQQKVSTTTRNDLSLTGMRLFKNRWNGIVLAQAQQNEELNLARRLLTGAGIGRYFIQSNSQVLNASVGVDVTTEKYYDSTSAQESMEAILSVSYQAFRFVSPKLSLTTSLVTYPSLTTAGRVRIQFQTQVRYELLRSFYVTLGLTDSYDSKPGEEKATKNDYGVTFAVSWSVQ